MRKVKFSDCVEYMIKGPFGSDMKKSLYVSKGNNTYKVYIQANAIQKDQSLGDYYVSEEYFHQKLERFEVHSGDYLITCDGTLGKFIKLNENIEKGVISSSLLLLKLKNDTIYDKYFELVWEYSMLGYLASQARNACLVHLPSAKAIGDVEIFLPDLKEQVELADRAFSVSDIVEKRKTELGLLDNLVKARFVEMFGDPETNPKDWEKKPLADVITTANNGMARRGNDEDRNIVMRLVELQDGYIDYSKTNRIVLSEAEKKRYLLKDKDFLFARVNGNPENVGRCAVFYDIGEPVFHNDHIIRVHFDDNVLDGPFASALLNSEYGKRQLRNQIKTSAGQYTVSQDGIGAIVAILPPIEIQRQFAAFVAQVDKSKLFHYFWDISCVFKLCTTVAPHERVGLSVLWMILTIYMRKGNYNG